MSETKVKEEGFSGWRSILFPIHWHEMKKFWPMALMMLLILFNYTILRNTKDALIINARGSDAEVIPFLKLWGVTPSAILFMLLYNRLTTYFARERVFYLCIVPFLAFFAAFAAVIYPFVDYLHPSVDLVANLKLEYPRFKWFISLWGNWSYALFYILSELWGSVMLSLLFWQFANFSTAKEQAKRFYPLFGCIGNLGLVISGSFMEYFANFGTGMASGQDPWQVTLSYLMSCIVISGIGVVALYWFLNRLFERQPAMLPETAAPKKKKVKLSIGQSLRYIATSPHLLCIALIVFSYGITINFIDVLWKGQVKLYFAGDMNAFGAYMGNFSRTTGLIAMPIMLLGGNILRHFSWFRAALITPAIIFTTGIIFFGVVWYGTTFNQPSVAMIDLFGLVTISTVGLAVQCGFWQNSIGKATKYSLFDSTKEMAYMPLDDELKTNGKAAVDVVGGRAGKSGGSAVFVFLQTLLPGLSLTMLTPYLTVVFVAVMGVWVVSLVYLNRSISNLDERGDEQTTVSTAEETETKAKDTTVAA